MYDTQGIYYNWSNLLKKWVKWPTVETVSWLENNLYTANTYYETCSAAAPSIILVTNDSSGIKINQFK